MWVHLTPLHEERQNLETRVSDWVFSMEPRRLELLTPCMPCSSITAPDLLQRNGLTGLCQCV